MSKLLLAKGRVPIGSRFIHAKHHGCRYLRFDYRYAPNHKFLIFMKSYVIFYEVKNMALNGVFRQPPPPGPSTKSLYRGLTGALYPRLLPPLVTKENQINV